MKITKSQLKQIIKEELDEALPPHLQSKVDAYEKKKQKYSITDVTPPGYGPDEEDEDEPLKLGTPKQDPMGRGAKTSDLRRKVGGKGTGSLEEAKVPKSVLKTLRTWSKKHGKSLLNFKRSDYKAADMGFVKMGETNPNIYHLTDLGREVLAANPPEEHLEE